MDQDSVSRAIARTAMAHRARAARLLAPLGLHPGQEFLLGSLWRDGSLPIGVLAERMRVEPPTVTKMVSRMEAAGLLCRRPDPTDGRRVVVECTDAGRALEEAVAEAWTALESQTLADLSADESDLLAALLGRVEASLRGGDAPSC